jgi:hypothetical protein
MRRQLASRQDRGLAVPFHLALVNSDQLVTPHSETTWPRSYLAAELRSSDD